MKSNIEALKNIRNELINIRKNISCLEIPDTDSIHSMLFNISFVIDTLNQKIGEEVK